MHDCTDIESDPHTLHTIDVEFEAIDSRFIPKRMHKEDAGYDLSSRIRVIIHAGESVDIPLGVKISVPYGYYIQLHPRSSIAKLGLRMNAVGIVDCGYHEELTIRLHNTTQYDIEIQEGERIAQIIFCECINIRMLPSTQFTNPSRGGGFGSTGKFS